MDCTHYEEEEASDGSVISISSGRNICYVLSHAAPHGAPIKSQSAKHRTSFWDLKQEK
jgi:hypothetical protein